MRPQNENTKNILIVGAGQALAMAAYLIGYRLLTTLITPGVFGKVSLLLGVLGLVHCVLIVPIGQAFIALFPEASKNGFLNGLKEHTIRSIAAAQLPFVVFLGLFVVIMGPKWLFSMWVLLPLAIIFAADSARTYVATVLVSSEGFSRYSILTVVEGAVRPLLCVGLVTLSGLTEVSVLCGHALGAATVTAFSLALLRGRNVPTSRSMSLSSGQRREFYGLALPILVTGLAGWAQGMGDRYIIATFLTFENVGIYAAAYGLALRPVMLLAGVVETALQARIHRAVVNADLRAEKRLSTLYVSLVTVFGCAVSLGFHFGGAELTEKYLLGADFRGAAKLLPLLSIGATALSLANWYHRRLFAEKKVKSILAIRVASGAASVLIPAALVPTFGLMGAAAACPVYFGLDLALAFGAVRIGRSRVPAQVDRDDTSRAVG